MPPSRFAILLALVLSAGAVTVLAGALMPPGVSVVAVPLALAACVVLWAVRRRGG